MNYYICCTQKSEFFWIQIQTFGLEGVRPVIYLEIGKPLVTLKNKHTIKPVATDLHSGSDQWMNRETVPKLFSHNRSAMDLSFLQDLIMFLIYCLSLRGKNRISQTFCHCVLKIITFHLATKKESSTFYSKDRTGRLFITQEIILLTIFFIWFVCSQSMVNYCISWEFRFWQSMKRNFL